MTRFTRMCAVAGLCATAPAFASDLLAPYVGVGVGQSNQMLDRVPDGPFHFSEHDTGWKALAGIRPISLLGAQLEYVDFGHPTAGPFDARARAPELFALGYLPQPLPFFDLYAKAGLARIQSEATGIRLGVGTCIINNPTCALVHTDTTDTRFAWGLGAQVRVSALGIRADYERVNRTGGDAQLVSLDLLWML